MLAAHQHSSTQPPPAPLFPAHKPAPPDPRRAKEGASSKRKAADQAGRDPKQQRAGTPAAAESSYGNTPNRTPTPQPTPYGPTGGGGGVDMPTDLLSLFRPGPGVNLVEALNNAQQVLEVLVKAEQTAAVEVGCNNWVLELGWWSLVMVGLLGWTCWTAACLQCSECCRQAAHEGRLCSA